MKRIGAVLLAAVVWTGVAAAAELPAARPESLGFSPERLDRITRRLEADVEKKVIPGAVLLVSRHGKVAYFEAVGEQDPATRAPMRKDSIFRIYSMTKPVTTVAAMMLVEDGRLGVGDPLRAYLPAFAEPKVGVEKPGAPLDLVPAQRPITVQDLMRHSSGLTYGFFGAGAVKKLYVDSGLLGRDMTNAEFTDELARLPLVYQPGTTWDYSHATDVLGRLVEVIEKKKLSAVLGERLFTPLDMPDTSFYVTDEAKQRRIAEPFPDDRAIGVGATFGDPREARKWESGGGGLVGTATDYARFLEMLRQGGTLDGKRYLSPRTVAYMTADHMGSKVVPGPYYLPGDGYGFGLGFAVRTAAGVAGTPAGAGEYFWGGAGGTYMWVDPKADMFVVFMMQSPRQRVPTARRSATWSTPRWWSSAALPTDRGRGKGTTVCRSHVAVTLIVACLSGCRTPSKGGWAYFSPGFQRNPAGDRASAADLLEAAKDTCARETGGSRTPSLWFGFSQALMNCMRTSGGMRAGSPL